MVIHVGGVSLSLVLSDQLSLLAQLERNNDEETDGQREVDPPHESVVAEASEKAIDRQQDPQGHKPSLPSLLVHQSRGHWHVLNGQWPALTQFLHDALTTHRPVPGYWSHRDLDPPVVRSTRLCAAGTNPITAMQGLTTDEAPTKA